MYLSCAAICPNLLIQPRFLSPLHLSLTTSPFTPSSAQETHMIKVLENQNELTRILMKPQLLTTLPQGSIPVFDGQVLEYK